MTLNKSTALTLRAGVVLGMVLMVAGLAMSMCGIGDGVLYAGILVLILSPFASIIVSFACLLREKDSFWAMIAGILLIVTIAGIVISMY